MYKKSGEKPIENLDPILEDRPNSKLIISTPGGLFGFYFMGISSYIKENYDLNDYVFSGASAGAWNSLFLSLKNIPDLLTKELLKTNVKSIKSILQLEQRMKSVIMKNYQDESFDLEKLYLGVSVLDKSEYSCEHFDHPCSLFDVALNRTPHESFQMTFQETDFLSIIFERTINQKLK